MRVTERRWYLSRFMMTAVARALPLLLFACAHSPRAPSNTATPGWLDDPPGSLTSAAEATRLAKLTAQDTAAADLVRLDRLLDLFDAARFGDLDAARDAMWGALGGTSMSRGTEGTQAALNALLQQAWEAEERVGTDGDEARFLADFIMLVSVDINHPQDTESLRIRMGAYRTLAKRGHPRVRDNAHWRLFDHVRGVLDATPSTPPERRNDITAHVLYATREDIDAYLLPDATGHREPLPAAPTLVAQLGVQRDALSQFPRWQPLVAARRTEDAALAETALAILPATRLESWPLVSVPPATGRPDPLAPVILAGRGDATIEPGTPTTRTLSYDSERLTQLLRAHMTRDGRGRMLLAADPMLPSPKLHALLAALDGAAASTIDFAVREPKPSDPDSSRLSVLPVHIYRPDDPLAARPFIDARLHVHLDGRGPSLWTDGRLVRSRDGQRATFLSTVEQARAAFPHERVITLSLASDVLAQQLVELLAELVGGTSARFGAVAWLPAAPPPPETPQSADEIIDARLATLQAVAGVRLEQPYPLREVDQVALDAFGQRVRLCAAELERAPKVRRIRVELDFASGVLEGARVVGRNIDPARRIAMESCVIDQSATLRLREHRDQFRVTVRFESKPRVR